MSTIKNLQKELMDLRPQIERYLKLLETHMKETGGLIPQWDFEHLARFTGQSAIELGLLRKSNDGTEIYLIQRPKDDPYWPEEWHLPGTVLRPFDNEKTIWQRLIQDELNNLDLDKTFVALLFSDLTQRKKGACMHALHMAWTKPNTELPDGKFFPIDTLPRTMIEHHLPLIRKLSEQLNT